MTDVVDLELALSAAIFVLGLACVGARPLLRPRQMTLLHVTILMTSTFFGFGPWVGYIFGGGRLPSETAETLWTAYGVVALFVLGLFLVEFLQRRSERRLTLFDTVIYAQLVPWQFVLIAYCAILAVRLIIALRYGILFSGTGTLERILSIPYSITVMQSILEVLYMGCFIWASIMLFFGRTKVEKTVSIGVIVLGLAWAFLQSRRPFQLHSLIVFFAYCVTVDRIRWKQIMLGLGAFALMMGIIFPTFTRLRISHDHITVQDNALDDLAETIGGVFQVTEEELRVYYNANMSDRPLIIRFICRIAESQQNYPQMKGAAFFSGVVWSVPSSIYGEKLNMLQTEQLIQFHYGQPLKDTSLTWPAAGCADFGLPGALLYGMILGAIIFGMEIFANKVKARYPLVALSALGGMFTPVALVEDDLSSVFCAIRAIMIIYFAIAALEWMGLVLLKAPQQDSELEEAEQSAT